MSARKDIISWIESGCNLEKGIALFSKYSKNDHFLRLCQVQPEDNYAMLIYQLRQIGKISDKEFAKLKEVKKEKLAAAPKIEIPKVEISESQPKIRDDFPFLKEPDCPHELIILVGYKISAYHKYKECHKLLFACTSLEDCKNNARSIIENYQENRLIYDELEFYKEHKHCLGKHPIFKLRKQFDEFLKMDVVERVVLYTKTIPHRIWRIESEIKKGNKPHLDADRRRTLMQCEAQLAELGRILNIKPEPKKEES